MQQEQHENPKASANDAKAKRPYLKPDYSSEHVFETMALACGKMAGTQGACRQVMSNS